MKALDILIYILECGGMIHVDRGFMSNVSKAVEELKEHLSDKDDQIKWLREELKYHEAELEALQQRSCESCKHCTKVFSYVYPLCTRDEQYQFQIHNKEVLLCNKYESKEQ